MFKVLFIHISFLVFTVSCSSGNKPYFWEAKKDGKTSYFLGTFHYGISLDELLCSDTILEKLKTSDLVLTELGGLSSDTQEQELWDETLYYSPNEMDFKQLSLESQKFLEQNGISKKLSFHALGYVVARLCIKEVVGAEKAKVSLDGQVESIATQLNIPLQALDNLELRKPTKNLTTKERIEEMIDSFDLCSDIIRIFITSYKKGIPVPYEDKGLAKWIENRYSKDEGDELALKNRNEKWFIQFKSIHKKYDHIFIAAGFSHFTDAFNLLDMLRRDGFDTERVSCKPSSSF